MLLQLFVTEFVLNEKKGGYSFSDCCCCNWWCVRRRWKKISVGQWPIIKA
jgi:hypothetical protein